MIVETVKVKNATIRVHDDCYAERTEEEVKSLIDGCCRIIQEALLRKEKRGVMLKKVADYFGVSIEYFLE